MIGALRGTRDYVADLWAAWNRFWFAPADPATLSLIRLLAGGLLLYTHAVWTLDLQAFLGPDGWLPVSFLQDPVHERAWSAWSLFFWIKWTWLLWGVHGFALLVFACLMLGLFTRTMAVLAWLLAVSYAQRVTPGAYFGLDQVSCMLAMYLMLGPCGARYSIDRIRQMRRGRTDDPPRSTAANLAVRLVQVHLCVIYLFAGLAKLADANWLAGTGVWWEVANLEYQSLDMTWLAGWPVLVALLTHVVLFWELFYCCVVWNRRLRPMVLLIALGVHGTVAVAMGMATFALAMLTANLAFVSPKGVRRVCDPVASRVSRLFA